MTNDFILKLVADAEKEFGDITATPITPDELEISTWIKEYGAARKMDIVMLLRRQERMEKALKDAIAFIEGDNVDYYWFLQELREALPGD